MITHSVINAQGRRLVQAVRKLSDALDRPVSGRDLELHFRANSQERPELMQSLGQQLLKTSRPFDLVERVYQVGIVGSRGYYAADRDPAWKSKLAKHDAEMRLTRAIQEDLPSKVAILLHGSKDGLARNALAGWCQEMTELLRVAVDPARTARAKVVLKAARQETAPSFAGEAPSDLISRSETIRLLADEMCQRAPYLLGVRVNFNRFTAGWAWPQSRLFARPLGPLVHSRTQVTLLAGVLWPGPSESTHPLTAELWARRYGVLA
jgi:hypothetical protein